VKRRRKERVEKGLMKRMILSMIYFGASTWAISFVGELVKVLKKLVLLANQNQHVLVLINV
jgi:hypothetical protein